MADFIKTGIGGEVTDTALASIGSSKPLWRLRPLPLSQVNAQATLNATAVYGRANSLQSCCLTVISHGFDEYDPALLAALPPRLVQRVMARVASDRGYTTDSAVSERRPDEATIWAFGALADPEGARDSAPSHTLALPPLYSLLQMPRNELLVGDEDYPLTAVPKLYASIHPKPRLGFLTTLTLTGMDGIVNDMTVQNLKWLTHLTVLWMRRCTRVTDEGIKQLTWSLALPGDGDSEETEGRGMWRLRAWYLPGCTGISDRAMASFAKWPGLSLLDVRGTSVTEDTGCDIFNRQNQTVFSGLQPDMSSCTDGLRGLFTNAPPDDVLYKLARTLLKPDLPQSGHALRHLALHLIPTVHFPLQQWLHNPTDERDPVKAFSSTSAYRGDGVGMVYGKGASQIANEERDFRARVKTAFELQAKDDADYRKAASGEAYIPWQIQEAIDREIARKEFWEEHKRERKAKKKKLRAEIAAGLTGPEYKSRGHQSGGVFTHDDCADARSRSFVTGGKRRAAKGVKEVEEESDDGTGDTSLMLVRMVHPQWDRLTYASARDAAASAAGAAKLAARKAKVAVDLSMGLELPSSQPSRSQRWAPSSSSQTGSQPNRWAPSGSQASSSLAPSPETAARRTHNPFKAKAAAETASGVRPLRATLSNGFALDEVKREPGVEARRDPLADIKMPARATPSVKAEPASQAKAKPDVKPAIKPLPKPVAKPAPKPTPKPASAKPPTPSANIRSFFGAKPTAPTTTTPAKRPSSSADPRAPKRL